MRCSLALPLLAFAPAVSAWGNDDVEQLLDAKTRDRYQTACPDYGSYSKSRHHGPYSEGPLSLPFQRPSKNCRTYTSRHVEKVIKDMNGRMLDKDLARLFENAFPNTLDTTVRWHLDAAKGKKAQSETKWEGAHSFIVTGDINAEWLRDSANQLAQYQPLAKKDKAIYSLILGAINTQAEYIINSPYCNAFQPPPPSKLAPSGNGQNDIVHPEVEPNFVFECKYEIDSLASFLSLTNQFYNHTKSDDFLTSRWLLALETILIVMDEQTVGTFEHETGQFILNEYRFQRYTHQGTETLSLGGMGNPIQSGAGLVRSAFRPSDDATILPYFIPGNAMLCVELRRAARMLEDNGYAEYAEQLQARSDGIERGINMHGIVQHKKWGRVYAYEVDGYGSQILMDDANLPSLLSLPLLGYVDVNDEVYQNTRRMILSQRGNPWYLTGNDFSGIGGPHVGAHNAWPMSVLVGIMTSDDDVEIQAQLQQIKEASPLGLIHETVNVNYVSDYTRSWFAWANSVFAQTVLDLARRKPHLLFGEGAQPYTMG